MVVKDINGLFMTRWKEQDHNAALLSLTLLVIAVMTVSVVHAAGDEPFYWEFMNVEIDVQENGNMLVRETQKYVFTASHTNERYRCIPLDKVDAIDSVNVSEEGMLLSASTEIKDNLLWIEWHHSLHPPESHTFVLHYRVVGGLHIHDDGDQVYWKAIFSDRAAPILRGKVIVRLPPSLSGTILGYEVFGVQATAKELDGRTIEFESTEQLSPVAARPV